MIFFVKGFTQNVKVLNSETKRGVGSVFIYNFSKTKSCVTDSNGIVNLKIFSKSDTLVLSHQNYEEFIIYKVNVIDTIYLKKKEHNLKEFKVVAERNKEEAVNVVAKITKIDAKTVALNNPQTSADMLELSGGVYIQKSQMGGGSPIIRGFEANRVLLVVDGVRLNNAIYRSGHLQNAITIDNAILESTDVVYGANSVIYGSDAIGGVVHYHTKKPLFKSKKDTVNIFNANAYTRYGSASQEKTMHVDIGVGTKNWAGITSVTFSDFNDLIMGRSKNSKYPDFGIEKYYADRINNKDTAVLKDNYYEQIGTGYSQIDMLQKISYKATDKLEFNLNMQYSTSSNIPRYDQLTDYQGGELKWAEWYYGPQNRLLTSFSANIKSFGKFFTQGQILASYQKIKESRINRRFGKELTNKREENVSVYGLNIDFRKINENRSEVFYGAEFISNDVASIAVSENIRTGEELNLNTRYPDKGGTLHNIGLYLSYKKIISEKVVMSAGTRYSYSKLDANFLDTVFIKLPFSNISFNNSAVTGSLGLSYQINKTFKLNGALSTAYRSPNIDDVGKVFSKRDYVVIPNDEVKPENAYNVEIGITKSLFKEQIKLNAIGFYTLLKNAIVRDFYTLNGKDSALYDGEMVRVQSNANVAEAIVYGASFQLEAKLAKKIRFTSSLNYTVGRNVINKTPLGHIPPLYGRSDIIVEILPLTISFYGKYNGWKKIIDFSPSGEDNEDKATIDGSPSWYTFNMNLSVDVNKNFMIQGGVENIFDIHYRPFASGVSAPGRNFVFTLRYGF